jgi:hypothetical protein
MVGHSPIDWTTPASRLAAKHAAVEGSRPKGGSGDRYPLPALALAASAGAVGGSMRSSAALSPRSHEARVRCHPGDRTPSTTSTTANHSSAHWKSPVAADSHAKPSVLATALSCRPSLPASVAKLWELSGRTDGLALPVTLRRTRQHAETFRHRPLMFSLLPSSPPATPCVRGSWTSGVAPSRR